VGRGGKSADTDFPPYRFEQFTLEVIMENELVTIISLFQDITNLSFQALPSLLIISGFTLGMRV